ncbi:hypothetical protein NEOLEDRAFT_745819 [Neolentinus lepideus HHB14362 ss-1]|uniref:Uncharacterized protein n=1 Tax=Neolentinus lepideus HHB14362 ss-1 TaxID=1314782 RepID=A0A165PSX2_9AGAM|nr:hypothetical protein NEOLEDRAFT_745819 [Neolentinus lepideus HHB14362 ss-1]
MSLTPFKILRRTVQPGFLGYHLCQLLCNDRQGSPSELNYRMLAHWLQAGDAFHASALFGRRRQAPTRVVLDRPWD